MEETEEYIAVDLEMTGLRVTKDRIIEIGAVRVKNGKLADTFSSFLNPHRRLETKITELTGITDRMLEDAPEQEKVIREFMEFAGGNALIGHNLVFDYAFLKQAAVNQGMTFERKGIDTLKLARRLLPADQKKTLGALEEYFALNPERRHRALDDAAASARIYLRLKEQYGTEAPDIFAPKPLCYTVKKQTPITPPQKRDLNHLIMYHKINTNMDLDHLTRSEASRMIDQIHARYGRIHEKER
jgi:DNA polymerase-3 subunit epsilon